MMTNAIQQLGNGLKAGDFGDAKGRIACSPGAVRSLLHAPPGSVDCHFHVYDASYPVIPGAKLAHPDASVKDHLQLRRRLGLTRSVIVQPSLYGADNRLLMSALAELGQSCRGVIAVAPQTSEEELRSLHEAGVRGARINLQFPAPGVVNDLQALDSIVARLGWSIELNANAHDIVCLRKQFAQLRSPLVFCHMGLIPVAEIDNHPAVEVMAELLARNKAWVKLSGTYNAPGAREGEHHAGFARLVQRLCAVNSAHLVWGSDWPHPTLPVTAKPDAAALLDMLLEWFPEESQRLAVLLDNPVTLYDFRD